MKLNKPNGYDDAKTYGDRMDRIPAGNYVGKILNTKVETDNEGKPNKLALQFDITEGEFKDYYHNLYESDRDRDDRKYKGLLKLWIPKNDGSEQDNKTVSSFKTSMLNIEDSNPGYHWDWDTDLLKGKTIGVAIRDKEYDYEGRTGFWSEPFKVVDANKIREGKLKTPNAKYLSNNAPAAATSPDGFMTINSVVPGAEEELPF